MFQFDSIGDAIEDIKSGKMIVVVDDEDRENEGDLLMAASKIDSAKVNFMATEGRGLICVPMGSDQANNLDLYPMVVNNTDPKSTGFTVSVDYKYGTTTGISMSDRAKTIKYLSKNDSKPEDFTKPGHIFPLIACDGGVLVRAGHTEAAVDLIGCAGLPKVGVICEIIDKDGEMARLPSLINFCKKHELRIITIKSLIKYRL